MRESLSNLVSPTRFSQKLIMVLEQNEEIGTRIIQLIRQETPFQAILATSLLEIRSILAHLKCDAFLLTDETFPEDELERLYLLPAEIESPALLSLSFLSWMYSCRGARDAESIVKAVRLLLSGCFVSPDGSLSLSDLNVQSYAYMCP